MDPNPVIDISSDEDDVCGELDGCVSGGWTSSGFVIKRVVEDSDDVVVIGEVKPKRKRSRFCDTVKKSSATDLDDDCVVLEGDPDKPITVLNDSLSGPDDLLVVGEKGPIACRDYPHARSLCVKFPFSATPHERHCNLCHCFVCDSPAPCLKWGNGSSKMDHCHATEKEAMWKHLRRDFKGLEKRLPKFVPCFTPQSNLIPVAQTGILGQTITATGVDSTSIDSAIPRIRNQGHSGGNLNHHSVSSLLTCKRPEFDERVSVNQYISGNSLAATRVYNSHFLRKHTLVSTLSHPNPVNGQDQRPIMDSESGTYQCPSFTNVVNSLGDEGLLQPSLHPHSSENSYMHRNQILPAEDPRFFEFSLSWRNEACNPVGRSSFSNPQVQSAVPTSEPSTAADYNHDFPSLPKPSECSALMEHGNKSLSQPKPSPSIGTEYDDYGFPLHPRPANPSTMLELQGQFPALDTMESHNWFMEDCLRDPTCTMFSETNIPPLNSAAAVDPGIPLFGYESPVWPN